MKVSSVLCVTALALTLGGCWKWAGDAVYAAACSDGWKPLREDLIKLEQEAAKAIPGGVIFVAFTDWARARACEAHEAQKAATKGSARTVRVPVGDVSVLVRGSYR